MFDIRQSPRSTEMSRQANHPLYPQYVFGHYQDGSGVDFAGIVGPNW
jgi:hypothetical protein